MPTSYLRMTALGLTGGNHVKFTILFWRLVTVTDPVNWSALLLIPVRDWATAHLCSVESWLGGVAHPPCGPSVHAQTCTLDKKRNSLQIRPIHRIKRKIVAILSKCKTSTSFSYTEDQPRQQNLPTKIFVFIRKTPKQKDLHCFYIFLSASCKKITVATLWKTYFLMSSTVSSERNNYIKQIKQFTVNS